MAHLISINHFSGLYDVQSASSMIDKILLSEADVLYYMYIKYFYNIAVFNLEQQ